jgi:hypothetical protein
MKYWEIIADKLSKASWSWGCVSAVDYSGRTIFLAYAHRGDGKRLIDPKALIRRFRERRYSNGLKRCECAFERVAD